MLTDTDVNTIRVIRPDDVLVITSADNLEALKSEYPNYMQARDGTWMPVSNIIDYDVNGHRPTETKEI